MNMPEGFTLRLQKYDFLFFGVTGTALWRLLASPHKSVVFLSNGGWPSGCWLQCLLANGHMLLCGLLGCVATEQKVVLVQPLGAIYIPAHEYDDGVAPL